MKIRSWRDIISLGGFALLVGAIVKELRMPREERTWHGTLFGFVPYDLRPPTPGRFAHTFWNPEQSDVVVPTAFGVGWSINAAALLALISRKNQE